MKYLKILAGLIIATQISSCYLTTQGYNLFKYNLSAKPLKEVYEDEKINIEIKKRIKLIFEIREYAVNTIGLKENKSYTKLVNLDNQDYLVNVLVAAKPDKMELYKWGFPFFGDFPYKGFYDYPDAKKEMLELKKQGYDTYIRKAGAFSTLGWFDDPIYSYMLNYPTEYLANLVIHEMTHTTLYLKDQGQFNEELATFIGDQGAIEFLEYKYGKDSNEYKLSFALKEDHKLFGEYINSFHNALDNLYKIKNLTKEETLERKQEIIKEYKEKFYETAKNFKVKESYAWFPKLEINNAVILSFITYEQDLSIYQKVFEKNGKDLKKTMEFFKTIEKENSNNPKEFLRKYLEN